MTTGNLGESKSRQIAASVRPLSFNPDRQTRFSRISPLSIQTVTPPDPCFIRVEPWPHIGFSPPAVLLLPTSSAPAFSRASGFNWPISARVCAADALDRGRHRGIMWRTVLWRAERRASTLRRRISFSLPHLSSGSWVHGRNHLRDRWFWLRRSRSLPLLSANIFRAFSTPARRCCFPSLSSGSWPCFIFRICAQAAQFQNLWTIVKLLLIVALIVAGFRRGTETADYVFAASGRCSVDLRRPIRRRAGLRHVFLLRLECFQLYHRRNPAAGEKCAALAVFRHARGRCNLYGIERRLFSWPRRGTK